MIRLLTMYLTRRFRIHDHVHEISINLAMNREQEIKQIKKSRLSNNSLGKE
jgi:hypothetical protein